MTKQQKLSPDRQAAIAENELNLLIEKGVDFEVEVTKTKRHFFGKKIYTERVPFHIDEPTLSVLDLLSAEQIKLALDEKALRSDNGFAVAREMTIMHSRRMAKIIAIAVSGRNQNKSKVKELTELFFKNLTPSSLLKVIVLINTMSNFADFCHSIRLQTARRVETIPSLIEEKAQE